jgi:hypothetical protein
MNILSIDGGGIRGIIPGQVLIALEHKLQQISNDPNTRIADVFDFVAGTSTGGILACLYSCPNGNGRPKFSASDAVNLYLQRGDDIFDVSVFRSITSVGGLRGPKYSAKPLENALEFYFSDVRLSQLLKPCLITSYDITRRQAKFFNRQDVGEPDPAGADFWVRDIARATILFDGVSETVDYQMQTLFKSANCSKQYLRLQADLRNSDVDTAMDNASEKNMEALERAGSKLAADNDAALTAFAKLL